MTATTTTTTERLQPQPQVGRLYLQRIGHDIPAKINLSSRSKAYIAKRLSQRVGTETKVYLSVQIGQEARRLGTTET